MNLSDNGIIIIFITVPSGDKSDEIARTLVGEKLAACVNCIDAVQSTYFWKGELCKDEEALLIVKAAKDKYGEIERRVRELHPYEIPEILALEPVSGLNDYIQWVRSGGIS